VAESTGDLSIPLSWCYVALRQAERVRESYGVWRAVRAAGEESDQLDFLYWGDVHFLISATHQMSEALDGLPGGPKLPNSCARCRQMQSNAARARGRARRKSGYPGGASAASRCHLRWQTLQESAP
jgi:hypothetical protein